MNAFKLPIDNAWEAVERHLEENEQLGSAVFKLSQYNVGHHSNYVLIASTGSDGKKDIYAAAESNEEPVHLHKPSELFVLADKHYLGLPVKNAHQAGAVIHVLEDAAKNGISVIQAINYIADRVK